MAASLHAEIVPFGWMLLLSSAFTPFVTLASGDYAALAACGLAGALVADGMLWYGTRSSHEARRQASRSIAALVTLFLAGHLVVVLSAG